MIAGGQEILEFVVNYNDGTPVDLQQVSDIYWQLCRYGQYQNQVLKKKYNEIYDTNKFQIILQQDDTENLMGKFIQQPVIIDFNGNIHRFQQGIINIIPAING